MYYLMNKDVVCAAFDKKDDRWVVLKYTDRMPIGRFGLDRWLEDRKAYKHNQHLRQLMIDCGCDTAEGFIKITHAASINDTFWVKGEDEAVAWKDVSFCRNEFDDVVSKLAFEGRGLNGIQVKATPPELTTDGSFRKCWRKEDDGICLYKRGTSGAYNAGLEPYCEALASELVHAVDPSSVLYSVVKLHGETASKCRAFTNEDVGFVPLRKLVDPDASPQRLLNFFDLLGSLEQFRMMLVMDAVTFNVDRHLGNVGVLVKNDTQKPLWIAPNFDFNLSMLPYVTMEEFGQIGTKLMDYGPMIGSDFTRLGQEMLTPKIRNELINLQGFKFTFRGNREFPPSRVQALEEMVGKQIRAVLAKDNLYTKDVFVPAKPIPEPEKYDNSEDLKAAAVFVERLKATGLFSSVMEEIEEDNHVRVIATLGSRGCFVDIAIRMDNMEISCEVNGIEAGIEVAEAQHEMFSEAYTQVCKIADFWEGM